MRLESARDLKDELLNEIVLPVSLAAIARPTAHGASVQIPPVARALAESSPFAVGATPLACLSGLHRSIALGIAKRGRDYRLAVRVQRQALLESPLLDHMIQASRNEAEVRYIGRLEKRSAGGADGSGLEGTRHKRVAGHRKRNVIYVGPQELAVPWYQQNTRPLLIGASIAHVKVTAGTLGAFVERGSHALILSNNHVLANEDHASHGDAVLQRAVVDGGRDPEDRIGSLRNRVRLKKSVPNFVDAALADFDTTLGHDAGLLRGIAGKDRRLAGLGPKFLDEGELVHKVGRTTGATTGRVTAFELDNLVISYGVGNLRFDGQIEIDGTGARAFSDGGDSGALIVNDGMEAVGLLFAGSDVGGANGRGLTYANPMHRVLKALGAKLLT